jgi:hypothetical protein
MENMQKKPHMLCIRSNGNPYFLYLTKLNFVNYCIFIDKKIQQGYSYPRMIISHFQFNDSLFEDTVLDGEMVKTTEGYWSYLVNDLVVYKAHHLTEQNLVKRINLLYELLEGSFTPNNTDICRVLVKKYFTYSNGIDMLHTHVQNVNYSCRGIYFKPLFLKFRDVLINFDDNLVKKVERQKFKHLKSFMLKDDDVIVQKKDDDTSQSNEDTSSCSSYSIEKSSCEQSKSSDDENEWEQCKAFLTRKTSLPDVYELYNSNMTLCCYACIPSLITSRFMRNLFQNKNIIDCVEVQYRFDDKFKKWIPAM